MCFRIIFLHLVLFSSVTVNSQSSLLEEINYDKNQKNTIASFKALQIVTLQSTKLAGKNDFYFLVSHRFSSIEQGFDSFFGLDNAITKIGVVYGINDWLSLGISRHTFQKTYESSIKYLILSQNNNTPFSLVGYNVIDLNSQLKQQSFSNLNFNHRLSYTSQLLISRKFSNDFTFELVASHIYKNLYDRKIENQTQISFGGGGRLKLNKRLSINAEYIYNLDQHYYSNPASIGLDIETGGHVFQLLFSNSQSMTESSYITNANGDWIKGDVYFGFNLYRVF